MIRILLSWVGALALAGCMSGSGGPDEPSDATAARSSMNLDQELTERAEQAQRDLSERVELAAADIGIERAEYVTWRNGALGCPGPGMAYTEALVPGYRIILNANGEVHHYHGARGRAPFHCPSERISKPLPGASTNDPDVI